MQNNDFIYNKIDDCLSACTLLADKHPQLTHIHAAIENVRKRMTEPMQLAIVGRISSSKSTLVNAILGKPEVVRTGHEAETFNVSWLKYGDDKSPITVHFKDGNKVNVSREQWAQWASHAGVESLKTKVAYIEVATSDEMLKHINIIDTPGLDATSKVDSENTKQFLKRVNPDAVVFLFTKSLTEDSLKLINEFQMSDVSNSYSITPLNSLGVLSKPDLNWSVINRVDVVEVSSTAISRTLTSRDDVRRALFRILPVSALMGLASANISGDDINTFRSLCEHLDDKNMLRLFVNADAFIRDAKEITVPPLQRKRMLEKYGLYGSYVCMETLRSNPETSNEQLTTILGAKSGFTNFMTLLRSHFGDRSSILKAQRGVLSMLEACNQDRQRTYDSLLIDVIDKIKSNVLSVMDEMHDIKEMSLLRSIYEGRVKVDDEFTEELERVCGEYGSGIVDRLNAPSETTISDLVSIAQKKQAYWLKKYNAMRYISEPKAAPYETIAKSYKLIVERIVSQQRDYEQAQKTIAIYKRYIYGKDKI